MGPQSDRQTVKCEKCEYWSWRIDMEQTLSNKRRYLTEDELKKLIKATRKGRYGRRDATLILSWPATAYALLRLSICAGIRSISPRATCTSGGSKAVSIPSTGSKPMNCGTYVNLSASKTRNPLWKICTTRHWARHARNLQPVRPPACTRCGVHSSTRPGIINPSIF